MRNASKVEKVRFAISSKTKMEEETQEEKKKLLINRHALQAAQHSLSNPGSSISVAYTKDGKHKTHLPLAPYPKSLENKTNK